MNKILSLTMAIVVALTIGIMGTAIPVAAAPADWFENWDSYPTGGTVQDLGGWKGWDNEPAWAAYTNDIQSLSSPNSIIISDATDLVHEYSGYDDGIWCFTAFQFVPVGYMGTSYFILLNEYNDWGPYDWSTQVAFDGYAGIVQDDFALLYPPLPLILDQWVEIRFEINLDANWVKVYYGGVLLSEHPWDDGGNTNIGAIDLFANGSSPVFYDNLSLQNVMNLPPVANDDAYSTDEDTPLLVVAPGVLGNDSDADGDPLTAVLDTGPGNGTLALNADGSFTYTPDSDFNGIDSFIYYANDGSADSNTATVNITVDAVNDPPVANDDAYSADEDTPLSVAAPGVLDNDTDPEADALTAILVTGPSDGTLTLNADGSFDYTPDADFSGPDSFTYTAKDGFLDSNIATVTITVDPVNDPPVANDDAATTDEDTAVTVDVLANDVDVDGDALIVSGVTIPANGTAVINPDSTVTYTPDQNYNGTDSFAYTVDDGNGGTDTANVVITVNALNDPPVAGDDNISVDEGGNVMVEVLSNDTDPDSTLSYGNVWVLAGPSKGTAVVYSWGINYTHDGSETTWDTFTYQVDDGAGGSDTATVTVTINPVNDPPVAVDDSVSADEGGHIMVDVLSNDTDPDSTLSYANVTVLAGPSNGTAVVSSVGINYTHDGSETTSDTFIYQVEDGAGGSDNATVTVNISPVNDPPVADPNGPYSGTVGVPVTFYGSNSSDCDGTIVSYDWDFGDGAAGSGVSPAHSYSTAGTYTVTLTVIDNDGASHMATTSVDIAEIEPEEMIKNLVDEIDGMDLPRGIKNSLTASLDTAIKVLEDSNPKNDVAAINVLKAFIKKVEAQCDKKIPEEVADDLIAKAQDIIEVLSLGT